MQPTFGTKTVMYANLIGALASSLQALDWVHLIPGGTAGGYVAAGLFLANTVAHAVTGNTPVVGGK